MRALLLLAALAAPAAQADVLATRTLRAGTVLTAADLSATGDSDAAAMVGMETRRAVYAGRPVTPEDVGPATLVRRNAVVTMAFRHGVLDIRTEGRALEDGGMGEPIRVLNIASRQAVLARVSGAGQVEVAK